MFEKIKYMLTIVLCGALAFAVTACSNLNSDLGEKPNTVAQYGSLTVNGAGRAIYTAGITSAVITISSSDIASGSEPTTTATVTGGSATGITIDNIPVGSNRVVTVQAYGEGVKQNGITIRAVTDIAAGNNTVSVTWETTKLGNVYYALDEAGVDIASLSTANETAIANAIPANTHAALINAAGIASAYKAGNLADASTYILNTATLTFKTYEADGFTAQVGDPCSATVTSCTAGEDVSVTGIAPGTWPLYIIASDGTIVTQQSLTFTSGATNAVGVLPYDGIFMVTATSNGGYDHIHYWSCADAKTYPNTTWPGVSMTTIGGYYTYGFKSVSGVSLLVTKTGGSKLYGSDTVLTAKGVYMVTSSGVTSVGSGTTIVSKPSITISPTTSVSVADNITISVNAGNGTISAATFSATCGSTTKTYTQNDLVSNIITIPVSELTTATGATIAVNASATNEIGTTTASSSLTTIADDSLTIYVSASSAPTIWVWEANSGKACSTLMGYTWNTQPSMSEATGLNYNSGWYMFKIPGTYLTAGKVNGIDFKLNKSDPEYDSGKTATFWYDAAGSVGTAGTYYNSDPTTVPDPVAPTVTIKPVTGTAISLKGNVMVTLTDGYSTISAATVTVTNTTQNTTKTYSYSNFTANKLSIPVSAFSTTAADSVTVSASVTNSVSTKTASVTYTTVNTALDKFTWDNALVYFVLTDRFCNGDTTNDHSYNRVNNSTNSSVPDVATFHGGDIKGLTNKLDYLNTLGVNAIWITAPYEQIHGWVSGKDNKFPHYSFHGYYTLDWTEMDKNMGTVEEFRTFVDAAHAKGIRVIMDIVMNHTGYNTVEDMITYSFGSFSGGTPAHGWIASTDGTWQANTNGTWSVLWGDGSNDGQGWQNWWCSWVRAFSGKYGYQTPGSSDETMSLAGLPDVYTEGTSAVNIPTFLAKKWSDEGTSNDSYRVPAAASYRTNVSGYAPHDYIEHWLASWVREFGVDGFRVDTAKHVERVRWGELKDLCQTALEEWRADTTRSATSTAKSWDEGFWMTGECFGWNSLAGEGEYYTTGKFDSMINFSFNSSSGNNSGSVPTTSTWSTYASAFGSSSKDSDGNGNHNSVLSYLSSHDTGLTRQSDQLAVGTMFELLPGGVQIFYGDESSRPSAYTTYGDTDMQTRGDMNFGSNTSCVTHWGKVGTFRKFNPAVGAGAQTVSGSTYVRTYSGTAGDSTVAINITSTTLTGLPWSDGTTIYNWYDGKTTTVTGGSATFSSSSASSDAPVLASNENPADFNVTF